MGSWVMAVEVTPSELVAVDVDRATGGGSLRARRVPLTVEADSDPVDVLADGFARVVEGATAPGGADDAPQRPTRLVIATPPETERRRFEEIAEATALVGLPAPAWLPAPVALVGDRISAEVEIGGQSVVIDTRGGGLTAWPVRRTPSGAEIGSRGPVATGTRLDQLLLGVVRAQLSSLDPDTAADGDPSPGSRTTAASRDLRGEAARLRREIRRARAQLASGEVEEARVAAEDLEVVLERAVFDQLVEHALRETLGEITDGPDEVRAPVVHVLGDRSTPLARRLADLTAGRGAGGAAALVLTGAPHDGVLGLAALLLPDRPRAARAASGAQAIRAARTVGSPPTPVGAPAVGAGSGPGSGGGLGPDDDPHTPENGLPLPDGAGEEDADTSIPEARLPSSPVQAQRRGRGTVPGPPAHLVRPADPTTGAGAGPVRPAADSADPTTAGAEAGDLHPAVPSDPTAAGDRAGSSGGVSAVPAAAGLAATGAAVTGAAVASSSRAEPSPAAATTEAEAPGEHAPHPPAGNGRPDGTPAADHVALADAVPHEVRPATDTPPGGRSSAGGPGSEGYPEAGAPSAVDEPPRASVRGRRGPDTAPQPVPEPDPRAGLAPRGAVPVLAVLVVLAVLAAVGVLLVGPDQLDTAFAGLGSGTGVLPLDLWTVSR